MALRYDVLLAIGCEDQTRLTSFQLLLRQTFESRQSVLHCRDGSDKCQYLVICTKIRAQSAGLNSRHGLVTVEAPRGSTEVLLSCSNTYCRRRGSKVAKDPKNFCPHTEMLWLDSDALGHIHQHLGISQWGIGADRGSGSDSDDQGVPQDRVLLIDDAMPADECENEEWDTSVKFDVVSAKWVPSGKSTWHPIPEVHDSNTRRWADSRAAGVGLVRCESGSLVWSNGSLSSTIPCSATADVCPRCGTREFDVTEEKSFSLFTSLGLVQRKRTQLICRTPGERSDIESISWSDSLILRLRCSSEMGSWF